MIAKPLMDVLVESGFGVAAPHHYGRGSDYERRVDARREDGFVAMIFYARSPGRVRQKCYVNVSNISVHLAGEWFDSETAAAHWLHALLEDS